MIPTVDKITVNKESFSKVFDKAVRDGKSCGPDNVSATDLLKKSVETGSFPSDWKKAKVTCVYKKGSKKCCSNYRPISLLSIPSKVVERYICSILKTHLDSFNLLSEYQWGFRKHSSTEDLLLNMTERWRHAIDNGKSVVVLFIDFQKAFDSVSHPILLQHVVFLVNYWNTLNLTYRVESSSLLLTGSIHNYKTSAMVCLKDQPLDLIVFP